MGLPFGTGIQIRDSMMTNVGSAKRAHGDAVEPSRLPPPQHAPFIADSPQRARAQLPSPQPQPMPIAESREPIHMCGNFKRSRLTPGATHPQSAPTPEERSVSAGNSLPLLGRGASGSQTLLHSQTQRGLLAPSIRVQKVFVRKKAPAAAAHT
jgi:hypothetical protein